MSKSELPTLAQTHHLSTEDTTIIRLNDINKTYGAGNTTVHALSSVDLTIQNGEYCAIMGASGSGKSTMMNIIGCLDRPTTGDYYLNSLNVATLPDKTLAQIRNQYIGFVFQQFHLLPQMSAIENVMLPMIYAAIPSKERQQRAAEALEKVGLADRLNNRPNQLSGGQQQRVAIARAIVNRPLLLLADEPTGALDTQTTAEVLKIFAELNANHMTVVLVTHEADVARQAHRVIWFRDGKVIYPHLSPQELHQVL